MQMSTGHFFPNT